MEEDVYTDDRSTIDEADIVEIDWPAGLSKPRVGVVQDYGSFPVWTKYARFLDKNSFSYSFYPIHNQDWFERAKDFDVIIGITSGASYRLEDIRKKFSLLESLLQKTCFPSTSHIILYEDKIYEAYLSKIFGIPYINTYISHDKNDAIRIIENLTYPVVSKIIPSSSSVGVELIHNIDQARKIVEQAFSNNGRKTHIVYSRQKNYVYFQDYVPNDGYDIRVIVIGNRVFGFYRKVMRGDFRASGSRQEEKRSLPYEAMCIARNVNKIINSPQLVVDMLHGLDGKYYINEFSPISGMLTQDQLQVNNVPGAYVFESGESYQFEPGNYWVQSLALKEFLLHFYLPKLLNECEHDAS